MQTAFAQFSGEGSGTSSDPYKIYNAFQLDQIRNYQESGVVFELMNDIDIYDYLLENTDQSGWQPIPLFKGVLIGNNHVIKGLYATKMYSEDKGLYAFFKQLEYATIKDLGLEYTKDISCYNGALLCDCAKQSSIEGCFIKAQRVLCQGFFGGLIGDCYTSTIKNNVLLYKEIISSDNKSVAGLCQGLYSSNCIGNSVKGDVICNGYEENISWNVAGLIGKISYDPTWSARPDILVCDNKFEGKVEG